MNKLAQEKSPYLLQHAPNPVHWQTWGEEAFLMAKEQDKPIFLSIGYSTCYWCHVMEGECFEDQQVADLLNESFVPIKIDREERPDVDKLYMDAVVAVNGHGGWPLSVFLNPALEPFYGGTYFPKETFIQILNRISDSWESERGRFNESSDALRQSLERRNVSAEPVELKRETLDKAYETLLTRYDPENGGFGEAPKFPSAINIRFLLRYARQVPTSEATAVCSTSLRKMARGGIYDHLGGGFHRYSVDEKWLVPHFEKMLYDNAMLAVTYLEAAQLFDDAEFRSVGEEILEYILRDMRAENGGIYSAEDAGDVGKEGEFYVWEESELENELSSAEFEKVKELFGITTVGNFENDTNIFTYTGTFEQRFTEETAALKEKLLKIRAERRRPHRDEKVLTAWNGLSLTAFVKGFQVLRQQKYLDAAKSIVTCVQTHLLKDGELFLRTCDGEAKYAACLDDYVFLIEGLLDLFDATQDASYANLAKDLQEKVDALFVDSEQGAYFFSQANDTSLIVRSKDFLDGALPNANGISVRNLQRLAVLFASAEYQKSALSALSAVSGLLTEYPAAFSSTLLALDYHLADRQQLFVIGKENEDKIESLLTTSFHPYLQVLLAEKAKGELPIHALKSGAKDNGFLICSEAKGCSPLVGSISELSFN